jgi:hypothetical protein
MIVHIKVNGGKPHFLLLPLFLPPFLSFLSSSIEDKQPTDTAW